MAPPLPPPVAADPNDARAPGLRRRLACFTYEAVLLFGVIVAAALVYALLTEQRHAMQGREGLFVIALFLAPGVYFVWYWSQTGQTLPMQTWQIRLVDRAGGRVSRWRAALRYAASWVWVMPALLGFKLAGGRSIGLLFAALAAGVIGYALLALAHPRRQFWHDALCSTRLIDTRSPSPPA